MRFWQTSAFKQYTALGFVLVILGGSSVPGQQIPDVFQLTPDKLLHCVEYAVFGWLLMRWIDAAYDAKPARTRWLIAVIAGVCMGVLDENYQRLIPNRTPDINDWYLDSIGVMLGSGIYRLFTSRAK